MVIYEASNSCIRKISVSTVRNMALMKERRTKRRQHEEEEESYIYIYLIQGEGQL